LLRRFGAGAGDVTNLSGGKGLELIPTHNTELLINLPPYLLHEKPTARDAWGDASFMLKYRFLSRKEEHGNAILTGFLGGSIPAGTYSNGSISAVFTPTLAGGKGWGRFDPQSTLGGTLPVDSISKLGRFPIRHRVASVAGVGFQIATTHYNQYNHAFIGTLRLPF
jgi:hypothetical protein